MMSREVSYVHSSVLQITTGNRFTFSSLNWSRNLTCRVVLVAEENKCLILAVLGVGHWILSQGGAGQHDWFQYC